MRANYLRRVSNRASVGHSAWHSVRRNRAGSTTRHLDSSCATRSQLPRLLGGSCVVPRRATRTHLPRRAWALQRAAGDPSTHTFCYEVTLIDPGGPLAPRPARYRRYGSGRGIAPPDTHMWRRDCSRLENGYCSRPLPHFQRVLRRLHCDAASLRFGNSSSPTAANACERCATDAACGGALCATTPSSA